MSTTNSAKRARKADIWQTLHNENFEESMVGDRRTYDVLFELLDPKLVKFQFQVSTIAEGFDATEYFKKYAAGLFRCIARAGIWMRSSSRDRLGEGFARLEEDFCRSEGGWIQNYFVEMNYD